MSKISLVGLLIRFMAADRTAAAAAAAVYFLAAVRGMQSANYLLCDKKVTKFCSKKQIVKKYIFTASPWSSIVKFLKS